MAFGGNFLHNLNIGMQLRYAAFRAGFLSLLERLLLLFKRFMWFVGVMKWNVG